MVSSKNSNFKEGDIVSGYLQWASYTLVPKGEGLTKIDPSAGAPLAYYLGVLGNFKQNLWQSDTQHCQYPSIVCSMHYTYNRS